MTVRARVTVTLEIVVADHWGDDCTAAQVRKQAIESATGAIRRGMTVDMVSGTDDGEGRGWARVVGTPQVDAIFARIKDE